MPVEFTYWKHGDEVTYDLEEEAVLSPAEAQVIATTQLARNVGEVRKVLEEMLHFARQEMDRLNPL